jgi:hypothetical protein
LQQRRQQRHRREVQHAKNEDQHDANAEVAVGEEPPQVEKRPVDRDAVNDEGIKRERGEERPADDPGRFEPVLALAAIEHQLHRRERDREQRKAKPVDARLPGVGAVMDEGERPDQRDDRERNRHVEDPSPVVRLG